MTQEEKLDKVLAVLAKYCIEYTQVYDFYFKEDEIKNEIKILLEQIVRDGLATTKEIDDPEIHKSYGFKIAIYRITSEGLEFYRSSSYQQKAIKERKTKYWSIVEKVSIAINAILLLVIAIGGLYVSNKSNEDKEENKQLRYTIDSLRNVIKSAKQDTSQHLQKVLEVKTPRKKKRTSPL